MTYVVVYDDHTIWFFYKKDNMFYIYKAFKMYADYWNSKSNKTYSQKDFEYIFNPTKQEFFEQEQEALGFITTLML